MAHVCPWWGAFVLIGPLRQMLHPPDKILKSFIKEGDTVLDFGCGPGFFTTAVAKRVGESGSVVAADLQPRMLKMAQRRARRKGVEALVQFHQCLKDGIGVQDPFDVILAFHVIHELPDPVKFINEAASLLKPGGLFYILEPRGHVTEEAFARTISDAEATGLHVDSRPAVRSSRSVILIK